MCIEKESLIDAIQIRNKNLSYYDAEKIAIEVLNNTDPRLEQNLREWISGEPISDIWIGKYCINAIMAIREDDDFLDALIAMSLYLENEADGIRKIWRAKK